MIVGIPSRFEHYFDGSVITHVIAQDLAHTHLLRFAVSQGHVACASLQPSESRAI